MGNRPTRIVARAGDDGTTGLGDGTRVGKDALRGIQHDLFDLGGEISIPGRSALWDTHVEQLDKRIEALRESLAPLRERVLPGGTRAAAMCHLARTLCRRAERSLVALGRKESVSPLSVQYLNRLSDLLFLAARTINAQAGQCEPMWKPGREKPGP